MNNKGQSLVIFVLILPIILLLFALIWEVGNFQLTVSHYENEIKDTIEYGLNHLEDVNLNDKLNGLLKNNIEGDILIDINDNTIKINVTKKYNHLFNNVFNNKYNIDLTYTGYKNNEKIIIRKE